MAPERPPFLVVLDTYFVGEELKGTANYFEAKSDRPLRVRWGVGSPPPGYLAEGGGVVFVAGQGEPRPPDENAAIQPYNQERYRYSEGLGGVVVPLVGPGTVDQKPWMMLVMILPRGYTLADPEPAPDGSRVFGDRLAVYWALEGSVPTLRAIVDWGLRPTEGDLSKALREMNARSHARFDESEAKAEHDVFLSYRHDDSKWAAGRIYERLAAHFGPARVFRDNRSIPKGRDFREYLDGAVGRCRAMLVVIGPSWLDPEKRHGKRRIDDEKDWVRIEVEAALQRHIPVVPLLLNGTSPPTSEALPESLRELAFRQGQSLREESFDQGIEALIDELKQHVQPSTRLARK